MADFSEARAVMVIYGQPLSLKTTLAMDLARYMQTGLNCTGFFGAARNADGEVVLTTRRRRYELATRIVRSYLAEGTSVVVEGTFERREWRRFVFEVAAAWASGLVLVRCYSAMPRNVFAVKGYARVIHSPWIAATRRTPPLRRSTKRGWSRTTRSQSRYGRRLVTT
jgi:hypothetical protein